MISNIALKKPVFVSGKFNPYLKMCNLETQNNVLGKLKLLTSEAGNNREFLQTCIYDQAGKMLGEEIFSINDSPRTMFGFDIRVNRDLRKCGARLGEILRLSSIIEMIENNAPSLDIMSKGSAVYFHSKYKFEPNLRRFDQSEIALKTIIQNSKGKWPEFESEAQRLLNKFEKTEDIQSLWQARSEINELLKKYVSKVLADKSIQGEHPFVLGFDMTLKKDSVIRNREFFNSLFESHGIDYKI